MEITRESRLTPGGDCIVGVRASCGCGGIPKELRARMRDPRSNVRLSITVGRHVFVIRGSGHGDLEISHPDDIVMRKSGFVCPRTLAVRCDAGSDAMPRSMVRLLQNPLQKGILRIEAD